MKALKVALKEFADILTSKRLIGLVSAMILLYLLFTTQLAAFTSINAVSFIGFMGGSMISLGGGIIGLAIGFDTLSREKERGTLRTLLSHPIFRDEILIGKALAAFLAICLIVFVTLLVMLGIAMVHGYVPTSSDAAIFAKFFLATVGYIYSMFSISLFFSALLKDSSSSLTASIVLFIVLVIVIPTISFFAAQALAGPPPEPPETVEWSDKSFEDIRDSPEWKRYEEESEAYYRRVTEISNTISLLSPMSSYANLVASFTSEDVTFIPKDTTKNALTFIIIPLVFTTLSYVRFTREEL